MGLETRDLVCYEDVLRSLNAESDADCPGLLFCKGTLLELMESQSKELCDEIDGLGADFFMAAELEQAAKNLADSHALAPVQLLRERMEIVERTETVISEQGPECLVLLEPGVLGQRAGMLYRFAIPFEGDGRLFAGRPSVWETLFPWGEVLGPELHVLCKTTSRDASFIRAAIDRNVNMVERWLERANADARAFNFGLAGLARERLGKRKEKLLQDNVIVQGLGFPIRTRDGAPQTYEVPVRRKELPVIVASSGAKPAAPDPHLDMAAYESILQTIASMGRVLELSPTAFATMGEEALRFVLLVPLNIHYEGQASGETFNFDGRTDILIRVGGRNIFIAECLIWEGAVGLEKKIDQLLGYASWRDTKAAMLVFNRNKNFSSVLQQIRRGVTTHPKCERPDFNYKNETGFRFVLNHRDDRERHLTLTVLVFDVPAILPSPSGEPEIGALSRT